MTDSFVVLQSTCVEVTVDKVVVIVANTKVAMYVVELLVDVVVKDTVVEFHLVVVSVVEFHLVVVTVCIDTTVVVVVLVILATFSAIGVVCTGEKSSTAVVPGVR